MGIKDFYRYFKIKYPECFTYMEYSNFKYKKIAIDMMNLIYIYRARSESEWITYVLRFLLKLRKQFIHPVCVFDGISHPLKQATVQKRREERTKGRNRVDNLREEVEWYIQTNEQKENLQKLVDSKTEFVYEEKVDIDKVNEYLNKLMKNYSISFKSTDIQLLKELIESLGICVITADHDAEAYCSYLSSSGEVEVVLSNDSDVFFFGCKSVLFNFTEEGGFLVYFEDIIKCLEVSREQFIDICLLCGTDFNDSVRGIGFAKSLALIKKYSSISNKEMPIYDQLEHELLEQVRKFTEPTEVKSNYCKEIDIKKVELLFFKHQINIMYKNYDIPRSLLILES